MSVTQWRPFIRALVAAWWPELPDGPTWLEAQVQAESGGDADAVSYMGALGLLQLMPRTAEELGGGDLLDPATNLRLGVRYLKIQYDHLAEVPSHDDRLRWSFASYNMGRGYANKAFALARRDGDPLWWQWERGRFYLFHRECTVAGKSPRYRETWNYVTRIEAYARTILDQGERP